jgi:predicted ribosomally synthesized peptide with SipW-like signal peptide
MSSTKTKRYLMLLAAVGLIAAGLGGTGTFASFTAETTNNGNYFATGTLLLHNNGGTNTCTSEADSANENNAVTNNCDVLFNYPLSDQSPHFASLTLTNAGTLDASNIKWSSPGGCSTSDANVNAVLTTGLSGTVSSLQFTGGLKGATISNLGSVTVTYGGHSQTFTASASAALGAGSVTVQNVAANFAYPPGSAVHATTSGPAFATADICPNLQVVIIETDSSLLEANAVKCVYGTAAVNDCVFDSSHTLANPPGPTDVPTSLANLNVDTAGANPGKLAANVSRYFLIGVKLASTADNTYQNRAATFALRWHIDT